MTPTIKRAWPLIPVLVLLQACGGGHADGEVARKRAERDSLKAAYEQVGKQLKAVEEWLVENDSTVHRNLPVITAAAVANEPFAHYVDVHGNVRADKAAALYSNGGRVRKIHVAPGDRVAAGQLIITIDNDLAAEQIQQAEAAVDLARTAFQKQERLWQQKIGSEMQYLQAKSQKEQAEAGLATLREQQRLTNITAPFNGTVDEIMVRMGDMTSPMQPAARVVDLSGVQLEADVPESYLRTIKTGAPVVVTFPSVGDTFQAKLDHVGQFIDPANRTFKVTVRVPQGERLMRPNLLSDISIQDHRSDSALVVPARAVLQDVKGNNYVYVLDTTNGGDEAKARKVMVQRISEYKGRVQVAPVDNGALKGGDRIVNEGAKNVTDGLAVRVAN
ncbi:MAG: efflux RND transporter periplasmic adaptor subunit [Flavobacteriales bacterium]|nr:efflux RND transporter periplasmic adaptor subunit [Flavobacteriales bacterium]